MLWDHNLETEYFETGILKGRIELDGEKWSIWYTAITEKKEGYVILETEDLEFDRRKCIRISILSPKCLQYDIKLSTESIKIFNDIMHDKWELVVNGYRDALHLEFESDPAFEALTSYMQCPDYTQLKFEKNKLLYPKRSEYQTICNLKDTDIVYYDLYHNLFVGVNKSKSIDSFMASWLPDMDNGVEHPTVIKLDGKYDDTWNCIYILPKDVIERLNSVLREECKAGIYANSGYTVWEAIILLLDLDPDDYPVLTLSEDTLGYTIPANYSWSRRDPDEIELCEWYHIY